MCHIEIDFNMVYSFGFALNTCFSKYGIELIVALSLTNATKKISFSENKQ